MESSGESPSVEAMAGSPEASDLQILKRRSGMKLARLSSSKYRKASMKKLVATADQKTKLRKSRSIRLSRQSSRNIIRSITRPSVKKDSSVNRPTCSSAIKGSKFSDPRVAGDEPGCDQPQKSSSAKVCSYSYCSLHGHRHAAAATASPSLKRMKSSRKRVAARSKKSETRLPLDEELRDKETYSSFTEDNERKDDQTEPPREFEIPDSRSGVAFTSSIGGRKYTVLWMLLYENMVSDIAEEVPVRGSLTQETEIASSNDTESNGGTNASTPDEQRGICQGDVVKLLQESLDKLLRAQKLNQLPDNQSVGDDSDISGASSHTEHKFAEESGVNTPREPKNDEDSSNRWSRLRKLILMKRFVKALEKTKRFNPRPLQCRESEVCHEAEVVNLRRPLIGERKSSEEWMLDYALREVVSKLDTDQQRGVSLLVEAFEKLSPAQGSNPSDGLSPSSRWRSNFPRQEAMDASLENSEKLTRMDDIESCELDPENDSEWKTDEPATLVSASASDPETANEENHTEQPTRELVGLDDNPEVSFGTELGRGKNNGLWSLIYSHMVSDIEANSEGRLPVRGTAAGKTEDSDRGGDINDAVVFKGESESDPDTTASTPDGQAEICQSDAVKLLQEALGKLLQQQEQDQSFSRRSDADDGTVNRRTENGIEGNDARASDKPLSSNRWSRLKKLILLKRFVRAVEKTKKLDPKLRRRHQKSEAYADAETVSLTCRSIEDRKRSEEWMLDYALRQAVSKLDQDQKRRVSLLVEAFEKVSPSQGCIPAVNQQITRTGSGIEGETLVEGHGTDLVQDPREMSRELDESLEPHSENKRYTRLWYSVYQHMVSGLAAEEEGHGNASWDGTDTPRPRQTSADQNTDGMELEKIEAVRLVQEAIDGILLPEPEDSSMNNKSPNCPENQLENAENLQEIDNTAVEEKEETESRSGNKFRVGGGAAKNWNNLKKLILIKRFVKSLEKVGKPDRCQQQKPRRVLLPEEHGNEEERVSLRRQDTDERKNAEEWMLDYAMRRVVSELTPARKRKVKLLVEAFEAVAPPVVGI